MSMLDQYSEISNVIMYNLAQEMREIMPYANFEPHPCSAIDYAHCIIQYQQSKLLLVLNVDAFNITLCDLLRPFTMAARSILAIVQLHDPLSLNAKFWTEQIKHYLVRMGILTFT